MNEITKAATEGTRKLTDSELRERIIQLGFGGDRQRFEQFVTVLREALPPDVTTVIRGSVVIGVRWEDGSPFDADGHGTSDLDLTLVGGDMLKLWDENAFYIPKLHTAPLNDDTPHACPSLVPLRRALCKIAGRAVNIQATSSILQFARDVLFDQPYFTLVEGTKSDDADVTTQSAKGEVADRSTDDRSPGERLDRAAAAGDEARA